MKTIWVMLLVLFAAITSVSASAIKECTIVADLISEENERSKVKVVDYWFSGGHSMGTDCNFSKGQILNIQIAGDRQAWVKPGRRLTLLYREVINMRPEPVRYVSYHYEQPVSVETGKVSVSKESMLYYRVQLQFINHSDAVCKMHRYHVYYQGSETEVSLDEPVILKARAKVTRSFKLDTSTRPQKSAIGVHPVYVCE